MIEFLAEPPQWFSVAVTLGSLVGIGFLFRAAMKDNREASKRVPATWTDGRWR